MEFLFNLKELSMKVMRIPRWPCDSAIVVKTVQAWTFEPLIGNFEVENETSKLQSGTSSNFSDLPWNFLSINFVVCFVNQVITPNLKNKPILKWRSQGRFENFLKFQLGVLKFEFKVSFLNFEVYDHSFEVRLGRGAGVEGHACTVLTVKTHA